MAKVDVKFRKRSTNEFEDIALTRKHNRKQRDKEFDEVSELRRNMKRHGWLSIEGKR